MSLRPELGTRSRTLALATLILGGIVAVPGTAAADSSPGNSAVSQYVEMVPTAGGSVAAGSGGKAKSSLSKAATERLSGVSPSVAQQVSSVATSPAYGAPADAPASSSGTKPTRGKGPTRADAPAPSPVLSEPIPPAPTLSASVGAVMHGVSDQGSTQLFLLGLIAASAIAALAVAVQRRGM